MLLLINLMLKNLRKAFAGNKTLNKWWLLGVLCFVPSLTQAAIGISTPSVNSGELIRASDWNKVKLDLETLAAAVGSLQNQTWESSGSDTYYDSGRVGIGINAPTGILHLFAETPAPNAVLLQLGTTDDADRVRIDEDGDMTIDGKLVVRDSDIYESGGDLEISGEDNLYFSLDWNNNDADTNAMYFGKNSDGAGGNFVELMRLTEAGALGVGINNPLSSIHTAGAIQIGGDAGACVAGKAGALRYDGGVIERCDGVSWDALATTNVSDNLGNHIAEMNLDLDSFRLVGEGGSEGIAIDANGTVGIGTDNPITLLDVVSDEEALLTVRTTAIDTQNSALILTGAQTTSTTADIASIRLKNKDSSPFEGARIALRNGDAADSSAEGDLVFLTNTGSNDSLTEKMRILDDGKVGIGTSGPAAQLQVLKNTPAANEIVFQVGTNTDNNRFSVDEDGDVFNDGNYYVGGGNVLANNGSVTVAGEDNLYLVTDWNNNDAENRAIVFGKNGVGGGGGFTEIARINENGRVGINENNPGNLLHVVENDTNDRVATFENQASTGSPQGLLVLTNQGVGPAANFAVGTGSESSHTKKFVVTNEGNVGVQETSPASELHVKQLANTNSNGIRVESSSGGNTGQLWIDAAGNLNVQRGANDNQLVLKSDGNVGIGTASPSEALEVSGNILAQGGEILASATNVSLALSVLSDNGGFPRAGFKINSGGSATNYGFSIRNDQAAPGSTFLEIVNAENYGATVGRGFIKMDTTAFEFASAKNTGGTAGPDMKFTTKGTAGAAAITIPSNSTNVLLNGNVGIGVGVPAVRLHVDGETRLTGVSSDGTGKVVCIKSSGDLGTCTNAPNGSGVCSCS